MRITILCNSARHPINKMLRQWIGKMQGVHDISLIRNASEIHGGDLLFLIACKEIVTEENRGKFIKSLIIHESDLPRGRGWSPHIWSILKGYESITISLLEAADKVDSGDIWKKVKVNIPQHALYDEINDILYRAESELMDFAIESFSNVEPEPQDPNAEHSYCAHRTPVDSELNPHDSFVNQFNLMRVCDPNRYPAFFKLHGHRYKINIEKLDDD